MNIGILEGFRSYVFSCTLYSFTSQCVGDIFLICSPLISWVSEAVMVLSRVKCRSALIPVAYNQRENSVMGLWGWLSVDKVKIQDRIFLFMSHDFSTEAKIEKKILAIVQPNV